MNSFDIVSRLPYVVVMLLMTCHAVSASSENLRGNKLATPNNQTLGMEYHYYDYDGMCGEDNYNKLPLCFDRDPKKSSIDKVWFEVWVKAPDQNVAITGMLSSYGLFVNYAEGGRLDWSGTIMVGASTFAYTKVDGEDLYCKEEEVPVNNELIGLTAFVMEDVYYTDHDVIRCPSHGRMHEGASGFWEYHCFEIINRNNGERVPLWHENNCYYKTLDDLKAMTRLLTPEQVISCYGASGFDMSRVC